MESTSPLEHTTRFFIGVDDAIEAGRVDDALRLILSNFDAFSDTAPLRERIAQALATRGRKREAVQIFELTARHWANSGQPARCLATIKQMRALQPDATMLLDHFAALYSIRSPYIREDLHASALRHADPIGEVDDALDALDEDALFERAVARATDKEEMASQPLKELPPLPLLSLLPTEALRRVLEHIHYEICQENDPILTAGNVPTDLVWTVSPTLMLRRDEATWSLPSGTLLGLNGFGRPRAPSEHAVHAVRSSEILRLSEDAIATLDAEFGDFSNRLATLRRHALTERLVCAHPLFTQLDEDERIELVERFVGLHIKQGEMLIRQNGSSPGLFIILDGQVDIIRKDEEWEITIATLSPGDLFGEVGLVSDKSAVAGVVAATPGIMLFLSKDEFDAAADRHPGLARYAVGLAQKRLDEVNSTLSASDLAEIE